MNDQVCSQHADCSAVTRNHGERIAVLEAQVSAMDGVQNKMVKKLEEAAEGLRALAGKIDSAVSVANGEHHEESPPLSKSINYAWRHFQDHFALFIVYGGMGLFAWALMKGFIFKEVPPWITKLFSP
jgi:hypothetical protein